VVQQSSKGPVVRRVLKEEVAALFRAHYSDIDVAVDMQSEHALQAMGGGCQGDMLIANLKRCHDHVKPINTFVPTSRWQVQDKRVVQGTLSIM
jgi:hypothetical protein